MANMTKTEIEKMIPHQGAMCLLDELIAYDENKIECKGINPMDPQHPLRSERGLSTMIGLEYGAQAAALHGYLCRRDPSIKQGWLTQMKDVILHAEDLSASASPLCITADRLFEIATGAFYQITVTQDAVKKVEGRILVQFNVEIQ